MAAAATGTSGFKLTLKLGGSSAAPPAAPVPSSSYLPYPVAPPPAPTPAPAPRPPKPVAVPSLGPMLPPPTRDPIPVRAPEADRRADPDFARTLDRAQQKEARGVSSSKYRDLKRKYTDVVESRDDTALALFRAQKLISRLREDKHALLDRVLLLESAAGLTSDDVVSAQQHLHTTDRQREFPLLHPPPLPSLDDRARVLPSQLPSIDPSRATPSLDLPLACPPRHRSSHIQSAVAAEKLRGSNEARRVARGLPKTPFPAVAVLGLEGSNVAGVVERALAGEQMSSSVATTSAAPGGGGGKRRRESSSNDKSPVVGTGGKGKGRPPPPAAAPEYSVQSQAFFPNPFAGGAGAVPDGAPLLGRQPMTVTVARPALPPVAIPAPDVDMDDSDDDQDDGEQLGGKTVPGGSRKHRAKAVNDAAGGGGSKSAKTRRLTGHGITTGTFQIPFVPRHPDGTPVLPLTLGVMILRKLGVITSRPNYATERYIFPIGFECTRRYPSMIDRAETVEYVCRIVDGGDSPRFEIDAADQPGVIISANTPTGAWTQVVKQANMIRQRNHSNSVSGPEYYGLAALPIKHLIQELPGANSVPAYVWQHFVEEPDPAAGGGTARPAAIAGVSKANRVVGKKRKAPKPEDDDNDDALLQQHALGNSGGAGGGGAYGRHPSVYSDTAYSRSSSAMQGSLSPQQQHHHQHYSPSSVASAYQPDPTSASLASLVNGGNNPYDLPPPMPYDPYALPLAQASPYHSPSVGGGSPHNVGAAWGAPSPWYDDQPVHGSASPYGVPMHRSPTNGSM
ncbi:hypothetical protein RQP46_009741 [Phenoliferia psychrophenolica]